MFDFCDDRHVPAQYFYHLFLLFAVNKMEKKTVSAWPVIPRMTKHPNFGSIKFSRIMFGIHNAGLELIFSLIFNEHEADLLMSYLETHV